MMPTDSGIDDDHTGLILVRSEGVAGDLDAAGAVGHQWCVEDLVVLEHGLRTLERERSVSQRVARHDRFDRPAELQEGDVGVLDAERSLAANGDGVFGGDVLDRRGAADDGHAIADQRTDGEVLEGNVGVLDPDHEPAHLVFELELTLLEVLGGLDDDGRAVTLARERQVLLDDEVLDVGSGCDADGVAVRRGLDSRSDRVEVATPVLGHGVGGAVLGDRADGREREQPDGDAGHTQVSGDTHGPSPAPATQSPPDGAHHTGTGRTWQRSRPDRGGRERERTERDGR